MDFTSRAFRAVASSWLAIAFIGQMIFAFYILMFYGGTTASGKLEQWNHSGQEFYLKGDLMGNIIFALHVLMAFIVTILGPFQLISGIRKLLPKWHRWSGRIYIASAFLISVDGLYLSWVRGSAGGLQGSVLISFNAIIIIVCAYFALTTALKGQFQKHKKWVLHLYAGMSGVWFFRVFLMAWLGFWRAPVGFDPETFTGPFLIFLSLMVYVFPQLVVWCYFFAKESGSKVMKWIFTGFLSFILLFMIFGTFSATLGMWLPRLM